MKRHGDAWKGLERLVAKVLKGQRVCRGNDFSKEDVDDKIPGFDILRIDAKYRKKWSHHTYLEEVAKKYCKDENDIPVLVTKHHRMKSANVTVPLESFGRLLDHIRRLKRKLKVGYDSKNTTTKAIPTTPNRRPRPAKVQTP